MEIKWEVAVLPCVETLGLTIHAGPLSSCSLLCPQALHADVTSVIYSLRRPALNPVLPSQSTPLLLRLPGRLKDISNSLHSNQTHDPCQVSYKETMLFPHQ